MDAAVKETLLARVYDVAIESPLDFAPKLSHQLQHQVYLKREDLQPVHSFKLRGAYNKMAQLTTAERAKGVIAASAGNHAQGVALSAQKLGLSALIVMPKTTPAIKIDAVKGYGAEVVLAGDNYSEAFDYSQKLVKQTSRTFIHPFDDRLVIAGQGTVGREILEQLADVTHIFVSVGGGGLLGGVAQYVKTLRPDVKIIGVEPADSNAMQASLKAGKRVVLPHVGIFADGVAVKQVGKRTFKLAQQFVDDVITVDTDQTCAAIKAVFEDTRSIVEPAGAVSIAGLQQYDLPKNAIAVAICSGANMTFERLQFIAERTLIGSGKEALYAVTMPEEAGSLENFCDKVINGFSITEFSYRLFNRSGAHVFVGIAVADASQKEQFEQNMTQQAFAFQDLSWDDLAKEHIRHMIGGQSNQAEHEQLYEVNFPERPGALLRFLKTVGGSWNISLFHYRGQGADTGRVLIGFECNHPLKLEQQFKRAEIEFERVTSPAVRLFL
jgi:threonine dehydratase